MMNVANLSDRQTTHFDAPNTSSSDSSLDDLLQSSSSIMFRGLPIVQLMSLKIGLVCILYFPAYSYKLLVFCISQHFRVFDS